MTTTITVTTDDAALTARLGAALAGTASAASTGTTDQTGSAAGTTSQPAGSTSTADSAAQTTAPAVDPIDAKYFPDNIGLAAFPSPENSNIVRLGALISGRPYLRDATGAVHQFVTPSTDFPNGYTVNGARTGGGGSEEEFNNAIVRQGGVFVQRSTGQWQQFNPGMGSMYNASLPPALVVDAATGAEVIPPSTVTAPVIPASKYVASGKTLTVGADKQYQTITAAIAAMGAGDTIAIDAGTYKEAPPVLSQPFYLLGVGGQFIVDCAGLTDSLAYHKGCFVPTADGIIENARVTNVAMDQVGAQLTSGIRPDTGCNRLTLKNVEIDHCQDGLATGGNLTIEITVDGGHFHDCGLNQKLAAPLADGTTDNSGWGYTHNIYAGEGTSLIFKNGFVSDSPNGGHAVKTRGFAFAMDGCTVTSGGDAAVIDMPEGSVAAATITNSKVTKIAGDNHSVINYGTDNLNSGNGGMTITGGSLVMQCDSPFFNVNGQSTITIDKTVAVTTTIAPTVIGGGKVVGL